MPGSKEVATTNNRPYRVGRVRSMLPRRKGLSFGVGDEADRPRKLRLHMARRKQGRTDPEMIADYLENIDLTLQAIEGVLRMALTLLDRRG